MKMHALWWWIDRWRKSTAYMDMTLEEQGAYRNLLDEAALRGGPLPTDERVLAKACGDAKAWKRLRDVLLARFTLKPEGWRHDTLDEVLKQSDRRRTNQANYRKRRNNKVDNETDNKGTNKAVSPISHLLSPVVLKEQELHKEKRLDVVPEESAMDLRAGRLLERYAELFYQHRKGARYHNRMHLDFPKAQELVRTWPDDERLEKLAILILTTDDDWISRTDRGFGVFAARASWADGRLADWEAEHGIKAAQ